MTRSFGVLPVGSKKWAGRPRSARIAPAKLLGISEDTLQNWEPGRRKSAGPAKVLLKIAAKHPKIVLETAA